MRERKSFAEVAWKADAPGSFQATIATMQREETIVARRAYQAEWARKKYARLDPVAKAELKAKKAAASHAYYYANRDRCLKRLAASRVNKIDELRAYGIAWRLANLERKRAANAAWAAANPERVREYKAEWHRAHRDHVKSSKHRRRARLRGAGGAFTAAEWNALMASVDFCCGYCGRSGVALEAEHRVPVARGGSGWIENIIPACRPCNLRKGTKTEAEFRVVA